MSYRVLVPADERGDFAAFVFAVIDEQGFDRKRDISTVRGGFEISPRLWAALHPDEKRTIEPPLTGQIQVEPPPAPAEEPANAPDEEPAAPLTPDHIEGAPASHNVDRETVRAWAKEQGIEVAERGQLKKSVLEAYDAAHAE
jgi:hypothetical protein